ncbi:MAG TPA: cytochrome b/b6 domain-containing protein [Hyphomonas sp.]|nr:cytochrome b/b6 domain-containing protein [Hyphomonas sp.]MCA8905296.1 cytochrome b/b6 domain-containing protein [Hyphomonas sp.]MCB9961032.1 cytochrome b/b6 domain-containing protein [Hyphomonas sp.]MCB9970323.1 cytochrome b/b6 domain-containing protein [Hyphomonas sp.]HPE48747.1 cytochrome b/b6 domain-containing protein [Hyphomonas sp.]
MDQPRSQFQAVWDPLVRIGHWTLVIGFFTAYLSGDDLFNIHKWAGYVVAAYVLTRVVWGFVGTRHARFTDFVRGPGAVLGYLRGLASGKAKDYAGHNPAGGAMVIALLFSLLVTTSSGMALYAVEDNAGPLAGIVTEQTFAPIAGMLNESGEKPEEEHERGSGHEESAAEELLEGVHKAFVYVTLALVGLHLAGVVASSLVHKENLARAMVTGRKRRPD